MTRMAVARRTHPGRWLGAALAFDLLAYLAPSHRTGGMTLWVLLDLVLAYLIWRGARAALTAFAILQGLALLLLGFGVVMTRLDDGFDTTATPLTVVLYGLSTWCLLAPALERHVNRPEAAEPPDTARVAEAGRH